MEKIKETIERDRYVIRVEEKDDPFLDTLTQISNLIDNENIKVYYNENNTGEADFSNRMMGAEKANFEEVKEIEELAKKLNMPFWGVISFYRENGWNGVTMISGKDALKVRPNNWVKQGRDAFLFVAFFKEIESKGVFESYLKVFINEGIREYHVYDDLEEDYEEHSISSARDYKEIQKWKQEAIEKYAFDEDDLEEVY